MAITPLPAAPSRTNFAPMADACLAALENLIAELNAAANTVSVLSATMTGNDDSFAYDGAMTTRHILDPDGDTELYYPSGSFPAGFKIEIINVGEIAEGIVFDPNGISLTIPGRGSGEFYTDGVSWFGAIGGATLNKARYVPELTVPVPTLEAPVTSIVNETPVTQDGMDDLTVPVPTLELATRNYNYLGICTVTCPAEVTVVTLEAHGLSDNDVVKFIPESGSIANEIENDYDYYADVIDVDTFNLMVAPSGELMDTTGTQTAVNIKLYKLV
ncbi:hypothetical protein M0R72_14010 [Candidatus Pacearchaeota archaeon]|nr:hypothetical protein [Candidatus Pacearchaeota archaeon]